MRNLLVGMLVALLLGLAIGYAVRANQDTFFQRCLHAHNYDGMSTDATRRAIERKCIREERERGAVR